MKKGALDGIRILAWVDHFVGPQASTLLSDLGAEVIKIEPPIVGASARAIPRWTGVPSEGPKGTNLVYEGLNRGLKSITLDFNKEKARQVAYRLVSKSDVFLTNVLRITTVKHRMDYQTLRQYNPKLIYARASCYGPGGPDADRPGIDTQGQARSGSMLADRPPDAIPFSLRGLGDSMDGLFTAFSVVGALFARDRTGIGQETHASMVGGMVWLQNTDMVIKLMTGLERSPAYGQRQTAIPLSNVYRCGDGKWLSLGVAVRSQDFWPFICKALGLQELETAPRFATPEKRAENGAELMAILDEVFTQRPRAEWLQILGENERLLLTPVNTLSDAVEDPQILENEYIVRGEHPVLGPIRVVGCPMHFSETPAHVNPVSAKLGQHTEEVLVRVGGYTREEITQLQAEGAI